MKELKASLLSNLLFDLGDGPEEERILAQRLVKTQNTDQDVPAATVRTPRPCLGYGPP